MLSIVNRFRQKKKKNYETWNIEEERYLPIPGASSPTIVRRNGTGIKRGRRSCNKDFVYFDNEWRSRGTRALDEFYKIVCSSYTTGTNLYPLNPRQLFLRSDTQRFRWNIYPVNATALRAMDKFITANIPSMRSRSPCYKASSDRGKKNKKNKKYVVNYCLDARIISLPAFRAYEARAARKSGGGMPRILRSWSYVKNRFD